MKNLLKKHNHSLHPIQRLLAWIWQPITPGRAGGLVLLQGCLRILAIFGREFVQDNIFLRSRALTFTVVLSLVPFLALGTSVLKGLGAGDQMRQAAYRFIDSLETSQPSDSPAPEQQEAESGATTEKNGSPEPDTSLTGHLRSAADRIFDYVDSTPFAALGAVGMLGLVLAVISVLGSIEQAMNVIWQTSRGRPFGRKLMDYLALMILLPLSINLALATEATLQSQALITMFQSWLPMDWLTAFILKILPLIMVVLTFTILYRFLPNTRVRMLPALAGGAFGGMSWLLTQAAYMHMQIGVSRYNAIYGSFATLPLFLLWLYAGWIIFLAGAEAAFAFQNWRTYVWKRASAGAGTRLHLAFTILEKGFASHRKRQVLSSGDLALKTAIPEVEISKVLELLCQGGLLRQVQSQSRPAYLPAGPADELDAAEVVDLIMGERSTAEHPLAKSVLEAARSQAAAPGLISSLPDGPAPLP